MAAGARGRTVGDTMPIARLTSLVVALFAAQAALLVLGPVLPDVGAEFGVSVAVAGQARTASGVAGLLTALAIARRAGRVTVVVVVRAGLAALIAGSVASAAAPSLAVLLAAQILVGAGAGAVVAGGLAAAARWSRPAHRARSVALVSLGQPVAWIIGQPLAGVLGSLGWRWAWLAGPALASVLALALLRSPASPPPATGHARGSLRTWAAGELAAYAAWCALLVYVAALLRARHGISPATAGLVLGACSVAYLPAALAVGRLADDARRASVPVLGAACAALALALGFAEGPLWLTACCFAILVAAAAARQVASSIDGLGAAAHPLASMGLRAACTQAGYLTGAAGGGAALTFAGTGGLCAAAAGAFSIAALVALGRSTSHPPGKKPGRSGVQGGIRPLDRRHTMPISPITLRPAMPADMPAVRELEILDSRPPLRGPILMAEARGRPIAAMAVRDGAVVADPFRKTSAAVALLRTQRELLGRDERPSVEHRLSFPRLRAA